MQPTTDNTCTKVQPQPDARRVDDRRIISDVLHVLKVGCRWRDVPTVCSPAKTVYNRRNLPMADRVAASARHGFEAIEHAAPYSVPAKEFAG
ncbi:transposase [Agrobacterium tumefaciens]|nr:transposase [Agrobacterium tumefaciens]